MGLIATCLGLLVPSMLGSMPLGLRICFMIGVAFGLVLVLEFDRLTVMVTESELIVGFHLFRSRTPIAEITRAVPIEVKVFPHGIGVHLTLGGALAVTARTGPGVVVTRARRRPLVFSCDAPDAVLAALRTAGSPDRPDAGRL
jgi:hypothetical protein